MEYISNKKLLFIHIPKCGGISVKRMLEGISRIPDTELCADLGVDADTVHKVVTRIGYDHPKLGNMSLAHIPLPFVRDYFPNVWELFLSSTTFTLTREPRSRFISALIQHLVEFKKTGAVRLADDIVQQEARRVCDWLDGRDSFCDLEYIHFTRQIDYTHLNGTQRIAHIFPLERTDAMVAWLAQDHGLTVKMTRSHTRQQPTKSIAALLPAVRFLARNGLPKPVREAIYPFWTKSFYATTSSQYDQVAFAPDVEAYIAAYYAQDAALYRLAQEQMGASPKFARTLSEHAQAN